MRSLFSIITSVFLLNVTIASSANAQATCEDSLAAVAYVYDNCNPGPGCGDPINGYTTSVKTYKPWPWLDIIGFGCVATHCESGGIDWSAGPSTSHDPALCRRGAVPATLQRVIEESTNMCGSIIQADNQVLGELIPITGANFSLMYFSNKVPGWKAENKILVPVTNSSSSTNLVSVKVDIYNEAATLIDTQTYPTPSGDITHSFSWNGLNASSQVPMAALKFSTEVTETYSFGGFFSRSNLFVGNYKANQVGLGGWVPSIHHYYDKNTETLYKGDGTVRRVGFIDIGSGRMQVPETDSSLVYEFNSNGTHDKTLTGLKGTTIYTFAYTGDGLYTITEPFSRVTTFNRDMSGDLISITSPSGKTLSVTLDGNGYLATVTNALSEVYTMTYSLLGLLLTFEKPNGNEGTFTYDSDGLLTLDTNNSGSSFTITPIINTLNPEISGKKYISDVGRETTSERVPQGFNAVTDEVRTTLSSGKIIRKSIKPYQVGGYENVYEGFDGQFYVYRSYQDNPRFGELAKDLITASDSNQNSYFSDTFTFSSLFAVSNWTRTSSVNGITSTTVFTSSNNTFTTTSALNRTSKVKIDSYERPIETQRGNLTKVSYTYTGGDLTNMVQGSRDTTLAYNGTTHLLTSITNALSQDTSFAYDSAERLTSQTLPDSRVINYVYDSDGNLVSITPSGGSAHILAYGLNELLSTYASPTSLTPVVETTYSYNNDKDLTGITKSNGKNIEFVYGSTSGLLTQVASPSVLSPVITLDYTYDSQNPELTTSIVSSSGITTNLSYSSGKLLSGYINISSDPFYPSDYYRNFTDKRMDSEYVYSSLSTLYTYDTDGLLTNAGGMTLTYNVPNGLLTQTVMGNTKETYTYNTYGESLTYKGTTTGTTAAYEYTLTRDNLGRVLSKTEKLNGLTQTVFEYRYDSAGRLDQVKKDTVVISTYTYDGNNNRTASLINGTSISATYDVKDQMTASGVFNYTYDANGFMLTKTNTLTSQVTTYAYDAFGNLESVTLPGSTVISYVYDGLGNIMLRKINGVANKYYTWSPEGRLMGEANSSGVALRKYTYATKSNVPDFFIDAAAAKFRIYSDQIGSPRVVVKVSNAAIQHKMQHDEFGRVTLDTSPGYLPFGFAGGFYDKDTGLVKFGARAYDPETGRWLSKDPILFDGGDANLYGYVMQDPVNMTDSDGLMPDDDGNKDLPQTLGRFFTWYKRMKKENTKGNDKYHHCMANCESAKHGAGAALVATMISDTREANDKARKGDSEVECKADQFANQTGRNAGSNGQVCEKVCRAAFPYRRAP